MDQPIREDGPHLASLLRQRLQGDGPLYLRLTTALRDAVDRGEIAQGTVLPPERTLARELAVSRSTVVAAYDRLKVEGWLDSRQGSGTWVRRPREPDRQGVDAVATRALFLSDEQTAAAPSWGGLGPLFRSGAGSRPAPSPPPPPAPQTEDVIDLSVAASPAVPAVAEVVQELTPEVLEPVLGHHGYVPHGLAALRELVADRFEAQGLATTPDQVVVTNGAHQALSLVARQLVEPGDAVLVESPTFPGALDVFRRFGAQVLPVPVDEDGARVDLLADLVERTRPRLVYLTPHFHSPTGVVMSAARRQQLAALADDTGLAVIEDLTLSELAIDDLELPPPIAHWATTPVVHSIGSASKTFWAGLRVGWVRSPETWLTRMLSTKTVADLGSPLLGQLVTAQLLTDLDRVLDQRREELRARRDLLLDLLAELLPSWEVVRPRGGLCAWVTIPQGNAVDLAEVARQHGVAVQPGPALSVDDGNRRSLRIVFARPDHLITDGMHRLADAWGRYVDADARPSPRLLV